MLPLELILIRHGQSGLNAGTSQDPNCGLTDLGRRQAREVGERLREIDLSAFVGIVSPYRRAIETAEEISAVAGVRFETEELVREWGKTAEVGGRVYEHEPVHQVVDRLRIFLQKIGSLPTVIVSHGAPIALLCDLAAGNPPNTAGNFWTPIENCCLRRVLLSVSPA